jgi:D-amino-acid dehydrogenase
VSQRHTIVVGGGIVGICSAYYLAKRGERVTLLEQGSIGDTASTGNAGIVALGHLPLPRVGLAKKAVRWMLDPSSPLYIPPRLDFQLFAWLWRFHRACNPAQVATCMRVLAEMGRETIACWQQIIDAHGIDCAWKPDGWLDVYRTPEGRHHAEQDAQVIGEYGFEIEHLTGAQLRAADPSFSDDVLGAVRFTESAFLNPGAFMTNLARSLPDLGVDVREDVNVAQLHKNNGRIAGVRLADNALLEADRVVLAAGSWSTPLAASIGVKLPMQAGKGYHLDLVMPDPPPQTACVLTETFVAVTPMDDTLRLAGTLEFSGINHRLVRKRLEMLPTGARQYFHGIDEAKVKSQWCGLRPCTADGLPVIGWAPNVQDLFIATGHAKMGLTHGPITGKLVSQCLLGDEPSVDITPMRVDRL